MWTYADSRDAVADALRLSRAMTFKAAVAGLPQGGGKGVIMRRAGEPPLGPEERRGALLDFAETVDMLGGRYRTAEDVGTSDADMTVIAEGTRHVTGLAVERGGSGDPSPWTALGVLEAVRVACQHVWGTPDLNERSVAVVGLGRVGGSLARMLAEAGARLVCADVDEGKRPLADELGADWTDPAAALLADVDVLAPCALGGVLERRDRPRAALPRDRRRRQQPARRRVRRRGADRARDPVGARLRGQRGRHPQHLGRARAPGLRARARRGASARHRRDAGDDLRRGGGRVDHPARRRYGAGEPPSG